MLNSVAFTEPLLELVPSASKAVAVLISTPNIGSSVHRQ